MSDTNMSPAAIEKSNETFDSSMDTSTPPAPPTSLVADRRKYKLRLSNLPLSLVTKTFMSQYMPALLALDNASPLPSSAIHLAKKASNVKHGIVTFSDQPSCDKFFAFFKANYLRNSPSAPNETALSTTRIHTSYDVNTPLVKAAKLTAFTPSTSSRDCLVISYEVENIEHAKRKQAETDGGDAEKKRKESVLMTDDGARDAITNQWRTYLCPEPEPPKPKPTETTASTASTPSTPATPAPPARKAYHLYCKTNQLKKACLTKVLTEVRGEYRKKIEFFNKVTRNKTLPRVLLEKNQDYSTYWSSLTPDQRTEYKAKWAKHGLTLPLDYPAWTDKNARSVKWCPEGDGCVVASPLESFYRNKCELTFGLDRDAKTALGFLPGGWKGAVAHPAVCYNVPTITATISDAIQTVVRASDAPHYEAGVHGGFWRQVTVRTSNESPDATTAGSIQVVIQHAKAKGGVTGTGPDFSVPFDAAKLALESALCDRLFEVDESARYAEVNALNPLFVNDAEEAIAKYSRSSYRVSSLVFQEFNDVSMPSPSHPTQTHKGDDFIMQRILNCRFKVSHGSFFQVNPGGADKLYMGVVNAVKDCAQAVEGKTLLFDVCCGTGSIGLTCIDQGACDMVVGVDIAEPAIENAKENVALNGRDAGTCRFVAGRAELVMKDEIKRALGEVETSKVKNFVAVVDPAREGLHKDVIKSLRNTKEISTIVYVSCNPTKSLVRDCGMLCGPSTKASYGKPFTVKSAQPYDMFPQTDHAEMLMVLQR